MIRLVCLSLALLCSCASLKKAGPATIVVCGIELYHSLGGVSGELAAQFEKENFQPIVLITQRFITEKDNPWVLDPVVLSETIDKYMPDPRDNSYVALDWEGPAYKVLLSGPSHPKFGSAAQQFIKAYEIVKKMRPKARIGYYGFPVRSYWNRDAKWRKTNELLIPFLSNFDVLFPSLYDFYVSTKKNRSADLSYVKDNTEQAIILGNKLNIPVIPFVWNRYHSSNKINGHDYIPLEEFSDHVSAIATTRVYDKKVDGIIWWSSEYYFYQEKNRQVFNGKSKMREAWEREANQILPQYYNVIKTSVKHGCRN